MNSITTSNQRRVGLFAGWGRYPVYLAKFLREQGYSVCCAGVLNHADELALRELCDVYTTVGIGKLGRALRFFKQNNCTEVMMAGKIDKRLVLDPYVIFRQLPDFLTIRTFFSIRIALKHDCRDDTLLMKIVETFAREGVTFLPGTDFAPELLVKRQKLTRRGPSRAQWKDICFGWRLAKEMGRLDIGQSVCVKTQAALAIEAIEGTDECIRRAGALCPAGGFTVVKVAKPQQDMRFDVPTFGLLTLQTMVESGGKVLAIESNKTIFIDKQEVIDFADLHNIVVVSVTEDDIASEESPFPEFPPGGPGV
ncbi:MAG: LpxI family protein [Thermoguttaceae bacterium]